MKAYTAKYDESAYFPERNLEDVVPFELQKDNYDWLGIETGANEISNLNLNLIILNRGSSRFILLLRLPSKLPNHHSIITLA